MGDIYKKVQAGQPLEISARFWNDIIDVVRWAHTQRDVTGALPRFLAHYATTRYVRNDTGGDLARCSVVGLGGSVYLPTANLHGFKNQQTLKAVAPGFPDHDGKFAVLTEPIASGKLGRAIVSGLAPVQVSGTEWYGYADISPGSTSGLILLPAGGAKVEYLDTDSGWGVVQIGPGGGDRSFWGKASTEISPGHKGTVQIWKDQDLDGIPDAEWEGRIVDAIAAINTDVAVPAAPAWCSVTWFRDYRKWYAAGCPQPSYYYDPDYA